MPAPQLAEAGPPRVSSQADGLSCRGTYGLSLGARVSFVPGSTRFTLCGEEKRMSHKLGCSVGLDPQTRVTPEPVQNGAEGRE